MAQITEVRLVDDLDGGDADESVAFGLDGKSYEIDLSEKHAAELREVFATFVGSARRSGRGPALSTPTRGAARRGGSRRETAAIREWAIANGHEVSARGRIPSAVVEAYENRGAAPVAAVAIEEPVVEVPAKPKRRARKKADTAAT